jgi:hypothetical protein
MARGGILSTTEVVNCPETELLLCCASTCKDSDRVARIRMLLEEGMDWTYPAHARRWPRTSPSRNPSLKLLETLRFGVLIAP